MGNCLDKEYEKVFWNDMQHSANFVIVLITFGSGNTRVPTTKIDL